MYLLPLQSWPDDALTIVAQRFLDDVEMNDSVKEGCVEMCKEFHQTTRKLSERYLSTLQRHNYVTPTSYLELISTYKTLLSMKRRLYNIHTHIHTSHHMCKFIPELLYEGSGVCVVRQALVICVMAPPIHLGVWSMAMAAF